MKLVSTTRRLFPTNAILVAGLVVFSLSAARAADNISGFVDETGRVVFVNVPLASPAGPAGPAGSALTKSQTVALPANRKLLARTSVGSAPGAESLQLPESTGDARVDSPSATIVGSAGGTADEYTAIPINGREHIQGLVREAAERHQVDAGLVHAIVQVESNYNPYAVSHKGARGLMQLIPATARRFGVYNSFDPRANLDGGIRYLKYLMGMFKGDLRLSLAAYNAGEMAVTRNGGVPPYRETQDYIRKVSALYSMRSVAAVAGVAPEPQIVRYVDESGVVHFSNTDTP